MQPIALIVLNYNTPALTEALASYLRNDLEYPDKDLYVIDNGSVEPPACTTHQLPQNLHFTRGMYEGYRIASATRDYAAYWFLNSDIGFEYGNRVLLDLVDVLFSSDLYAQISPQFNSPHRFMEQADRVAQRVPYLEPTATLIKASTIRNIGFWDLELSRGWGVDYDYGFRIREAGLHNILTNRARISHKEHKSISNWSAFVESASSEMHTVLTKKYGSGWERINQTEKTVPVILTCDRDVALTNRFVESYRSIAWGLEKPVVVVDISASPKLSRPYLSLLDSLDPSALFIHQRQPNLSFYESVQDAADFALSSALSECIDVNCRFLFLEDDIVFAPSFLERLLLVPTNEQVGFTTFYLPGDGYGGEQVEPSKFYGTQCVLFPYESVKTLVHRREEMHKTFPPGYDIRWSRFLAAQGYTLHATERSYVQHLSAHSRLHGIATHVSNCF